MSSPKHRNGHRKCFVPRCPNKEGDYSFHKFPKDEQLRKIWLAFCQRPDEKISNFVSICEMHFTAEDFRARNRGKIRDGRNKLHPEACPTLFPPRPLTFGNEGNVSMHSEPIPDYLTEPVALPKELVMRTDTSIQASTSGLPVNLEQPPFQLEVEEKPFDGRPEMELDSSEVFDEQQEAESPPEANQPPPLPESVTEHETTGETYRRLVQYSSMQTHFEGLCCMHHTLKQPGSSEQRFVVIYGFYNRRGTGPSTLLERSLYFFSTDRPRMEVRGFQLSNEWLTPVKSIWDLKFFIQKLRDMKLCAGVPQPDHSLGHELMLDAYEPSKPVLRHVGCQFLFDDVGNKTRCSFCEQTIRRFSKHRNPVPATGFMYGAQCVSEEDSNSCY